MLPFVAYFLFIVLFNDVCLVVGWNPSNFSFNPGDNYELVWQDEFENVGPVQAIINGAPAYAPNPKNWAHAVGPKIDGGIQNYTASIENAYIQNGKLTIVAMREGNASAMLTSENLQEFTFGIWAAKIRLPYGQGMWPAWWLVGSGMKYGLHWPTVGEIDILEMVGGTKQTNSTDQYAHGTVHWNNQSNTMNPVYNKYTSSIWRTPDGSMLHNNSLVYWTEWTPTNIAIGVNEFTYYQLNTTHIPDSINPVIAFSGMWPYHMFLNIAFGGKWSGLPDNTTVWPQQMVVDWVRVYQQKKTVYESLLTFSF
jgi:beta-glucanase (GH16 family)